MATTQKGVYYPADYNEVADIPEDMKKMAESVDEAIDNSESGIETEIANLQQEQQTQNTNIQTNSNNISALQGRMTQAETNIEGKVDKELGKGLSTEDYTTAEKTKLAGLENYDDTEVKADIQANTDSIEALETKHDEEVAELENKIEDLQEELDRAEDLIPTGEASGSDITLTDSARVRFKKIIPGGKSEQNTTVFIDVGTWEQGNIGANNGANANSDTLIRTASFIPVKPNVLYNIERTISTGIQAFRFYDANYNYIGAQTIEGIITTNREGNRMIAGVTSMTMTINNTSVAYMKMVDGSNDLSTVYTISTTISPDYECPIKNVGDNVNLFDAENVLYQNNKILNNAGVEISDASGGYTKMYIPVKSLTEYTIIGLTERGTKRIYFFDINKNFISRTESFNKTNFSFTTVENCKYIDIQYYIAGNDFNSYQIKEGLTTSYSPYNCGNVEVKVENKNLFDESQLLQADGWTLTNRIYSGVINDWFLKFRNGFSDLIFKENTQYTISFKGYITGGTPRIKILYTDNTTSTLNISATTMTAYSFTTPAGKTISKVSADYGSAGQNTLYLTEFQIEEASTVTDYIAHEEQTATFPLEEGQILHESDTIEDKIVQKRKTVTISGLSATFEDAKENGMYLCNKKVGGNLNGKTLTFDTSVTNAIVEYELAEPIEIPFTEAQRTAKAQIDKLYSYKGTTHITSEANLDVTYRKDHTTITDARLDELEARIALLE